MNDLANPHENIEKVNEKLLAESFSILGSTLDLYQAEEIIEDGGKDGAFDIFSQSLPDTFYHSFDHLPCQSINGNTSFPENPQITSFHTQDGKYSCKSKIENFPMFNKVWPDQLDILAGPLLEDDDIDNCDITHKHLLSNEEVNLMSDIEEASILNSSLTTEIGTKTKMFHIGNISYNKRRNAGIKLGSIVRISKDEDTCEEIDVVTVDEDDSAGNASLYSQHYFEELKDANRKCNNIDSCTIQSCPSKNQTALTNDVANTALEAPDLDSLLEQFEATEDCIQPEKQVTDCHRNGLTNPIITPGLSLKGSSTTSLIKRIKSSTVPSRSTIMISHETVLKSTSPNRIKIDDNAQFCNYVTSKKCASPINRTLKEPAISSSDNESNTVSSSDDHDYCSPLPASSNSPYYNKIPKYLTELQPRKNAGHNSMILRKVLSKNDKIDSVHLKERQNVKNTVNSIQNCSNDTQSKTSNVTFHCVEDTTKVASLSLSSIVHNALENENLSNISSSISETFTNLKCQLLENTNIKECPFSEQVNSSNSPELATSSVSNSADLQSGFRHDQYSTKHYSSSICSSPSHSPPPKWHTLRRSRSRSPPFGKYTNKLNRIRNSYRQNFTMWEHKEKVKQIEERRVLYVGNIPEGMTRAELRERFSKFGPIHEVSIHIRDFDDNYAFVTFCNRNDAYMAMEHGNDNPNLPKFELSFGGRRQFCKVKYADLDSQYNANERRDFRKNCNDLDFDSLLKSVKAQFKSRRPSPQS